MTATNVRKLTFGMIALALLFIGALTVSASATAADVKQSAVAVTGGKTTLKPTDRMVKKLNRAKIRVSPTGSARGGLRKLVFPVTGGRIEPGELTGKLKHQGSGLRFRKRIDKASPLLFKNPVIDLGRGFLNLAVKKHAETRADHREAPWIGLSEKKLLEFQDGAIGFRAKVKLTGQGARGFRSTLGLNVKRGTTFGILDWVWADFASVTAP